MSEKTNRNNQELLLIFVFFIVIITLITISFMSQEASFEVNCEFTNIEYINISGSGHCNEFFLDEYCPHPKNVKCEIKGSVPMAMLIK